VVGKYDGLRDFLAARDDALTELTMSFEEVEALIGTLPASAREHRAWWSNDSKVEAQAWRAAGWHVQSVNQNAGRVMFARGVLGGTRAARKVASTPAAGPAPRIPARSTPEATSLDADLSEATVQALLVAHLAGEGWSIQRVADTGAREHGIDILATRDSRILAVEVKGYPARRYADPRRAGEVKPTAPSVQARHWYAQAILKAMLTRDDNPEYEIAIGLPDAPTYRTLHRRTRGSLDQLAMKVMFIDSEGRVSTV
jgi:hypothetical protein